MTEQAQSATTYELFATTAPGFEGQLEAELVAIHGETLRRVAGGCEVRVDDVGLWKTAWWARTAETLRVRVGAYHVENFEQLERSVAKIAWHAFLPRGILPRVRVSCSKSRLYHTDAVAERVETVLGRRFRAETPAGPEAPAPDIYVRIHRDEAVFSVDAGGELLHKRGYRVDPGHAPMRETLAAACVLTSEWQGTRPLWDPFCGSGTLAIEAVRAALGLPVPISRSFAFELWPTHDAERYATFVQGARAEEQQRVREHTAPVVASDVDASVAAGARRNVENAALAEKIDVLEGDFAEISPRVIGQFPDGVTIVSNLPYGRRSGDRAEVKALLARLGTLLRESPVLRPVWFVSPRRDLAADTGCGFEEVLRFRNGGVSVGLWRLV